MTKVFLKTFLVLALLEYYSILFGQDNLFRNYSIENTDIPGWLGSGLANINSGLQDGRYNSNSDSFPDLNEYEKIEQYWSYCDYWTVPERRYSWCGWPGEDPIGTPDITYEPYTTNDGSNSEFQRHYSGNLCIYTGTGGGGEFVVIQPETTILKGHTYYIEVFVGADDNTAGQVGSIDLFTQKPHVCSINNEFITEYGGNGPWENVILAEYNLDFGTDSLGWRRYQAFFVAQEDFTWISVGSPNSLYWDDFKLYEVDANLCTDVWHFDNTVFNYPLEVFQAGDYIKAGTGVDPDPAQLPGPVTVLSISHTIFRAGNAIYLEPGFEVDSLNGAVFEAIIEPCEDLTPSINFPTQTHLCISDSLQIGFPGYEGTLIQMQWFPDTYLDDPNSATPTFIPPGTNGSITYNVIYTTGAFPGIQFTQVTVHYSDGLNIPPSISYSNLIFDNYELSVDLNISSSVDEIVMTYNGYSYYFYRDEDFDAPIWHLDLNHLFVSCCEDVTFNFLAKSYCGGTDETSFTWTKSGSFGLTTALPNVFSPDGDMINDEYCFGVNKVCSYDFLVVNSWGQVIFERLQQPILTSYICPWQGQMDNGNQLNDGWYYPIVRLYNDCGDQFEQYSIVYYSGPNKSAEFDNNELMPNKSSIVFTTLYNELSIQNSEFLGSSIIVYDNLGKIILSEAISSTFNCYLSPGIYYVVVTDKYGELVERKKIVIL